MKSIPYIFAVVALLVVFHVVGVIWGKDAKLYLLVGIPSPLTIGYHWPDVGEPERSIHELKWLHSDLSVAWSPWFCLSF